MLLVQRVYQLVARYRLKLIELLHQFRLSQSLVIYLIRNRSVQRIVNDRIVCKRFIELLELILFIERYLLLSDRHLKPLLQLASQIDLNVLQLYSAEQVLVNFGYDWLKRVDELAQVLHAHLSYSLDLITHHLSTLVVNLIERDGNDEPNGLGAYEQ